MAGYSKRVSACVSSLSKKLQFVFRVYLVRLVILNQEFAFRWIRILEAHFFSILLTESVLLSVLSVSTTTDFSLLLPRPLPPPQDLDAFG